MCATSQTFDELDGRIVQPTKDTAKPDIDLFPLLLNAPHRLRIMVRQKQGATPRKGKIFKVLVRFEDTAFVELQVKNLKSEENQCEAVAFLDPAVIKSKRLTRLSPQVAKPDAKYLKMDIRVVYSSEQSSHFEYIDHEMWCYVCSKISHQILDTGNRILEEWRCLPQWSRDVICNASMWVRQTQRTLKSIHPLIAFL